MSLAPRWSCCLLQDSPAPSLCPGECPQRSKVGSLSEVLGVAAEILPGICILPLQLMPLKALPHLFLAANVPAKETRE